MASRRSFLKQSIIASPIPFVTTKTNVFSIFNKNLAKEVKIGVIGTGWCGGIRANACHDNPLVNKLFLAETNTKRLNELKNSLDIEGATENWKELINNDEIDTIIISATPETTHYPMALAALEAGKNVFLEKPISTTLEEAEELINESIKILNNIT